MLAKILGAPPMAASENGTKTTISLMRISARIFASALPACGDRQGRDAQHRRQERKMEDADRDHRYRARNVPSRLDACFPRRQYQQAHRRGRNAIGGCADPADPRDTLVEQQKA